jgi:hypothetical protein
MPTNEDISQKISKLCLAESDGNWEKLTYKVIDAQRMRKFIEIISVYGNSMKCEQRCVDKMERILTAFKSFAELKLAEPDITQSGMARGFVYLFASLTIKKISVSCPKLYLKRDLKTRTTEIVSENDIAYPNIEDVD